MYARFCCKASSRCYFFSETWLSRNALISRFFCRFICFTLTSCWRACSSFYKHYLMYSRSAYRCNSLSLSPWITSPIRVMIFWIFSSRCLISSALLLSLSRAACIAFCIDKASSRFNSSCFSIRRLFSSSFSMMTLRAAIFSSSRFYLSLSFSAFSSASSFWLRSCSWAQLAFSSAILFLLASSSI